MAFIEVGIVENLVFDLETTEITEKGAIVLGMKSAATKSDEDSMMDAIMNNKTIDGDVKGKFYLWTPSVTKKDENGLEVSKTPQDVLAELLNIRKYLLDIGALFGPKEESEQAYGGAKMFEGLGREVQDVIPQLVNEALLLQVYKKLGNLFLTFLKSKPGVATSAFRHKFVRQSADKHYATIPRPMAFGVNIESMFVPKAQSKIAFSKYEIEKGLNSGIPLPPDEVKGNADKANKLYGKPANSKPAAQSLI
jgi:hypothetical protein